MAGYRLRMAVQLREARFSIPAALWRSLAAGVPIAAIVAATVPVWGMSWYFDTENWAAGIWNSWAEARTDTWREAMVRAVPARPRGTTRVRRHPPGDRAGDFSFIVIGDTGEGDASQHVLRDQLLTVGGARRREVRGRLLRRRLSERLDEGLRGEVLAALQGLHQAGLRHPRQPRLVRRARSVPRDVPASRTPPAPRCARASRPTCG